MTTTHNLLDKPLYLSGKILPDNKIPGEEASPNRFLRVTTDRVSLNDWDAWNKAVKIFAFKRPPESDPFSIWISRDRSNDNKPYIMITVYGNDGAHITMQRWDYNPSHLYTIMRGLPDKWTMPCQIMEMNPDSTARFQQFAIAVAEQTDHAEIKEALTTLWATSSTTPSTGS